MSPTVTKPLLNEDTNVSDAKLLQNLIHNYAAVIEYADRLEKANQVCK